MKKKIIESLKIKFVKDVIWGMASNILVGVGGILINYIILSFYGAETLGNFNFALSIYFILQMLSVVGVNNSLIYELAQENRSETEKIMEISSAFATVIAATLANIVFGLILVQVLRVTFIKLDFIDMFYILIVALPFFSINKLYQGYLTGLREMKFYSVLNFLRIFFILLFLICISLVNDDPAIGLLSFLFAEVVLFLILLFRERKSIINSFKNLRFILSLEISKKHLVFGFKNFTNSIIVDLWLKSDIFVIGLFLTPQMLGVYSFSAEIAKGFCLFGNLIQANFNPVITKLWGNKEYDLLVSKTHEVKRGTYFVMVPIVLLVVIIYPVAFNFFVSNLDLQQSYIVFLILVFGILIFSGYQSILGCLTFTGNVNYQLKRSIISFFLNIILSFSLIPFFGVYGAAISTFISFVFSGIVFQIFWNKIIRETYSLSKIVGLKNE